MDEFYFSGRNLNALARDIRGAAAALRAEAPATLERVGELIETNAKEIAASNKSRSIPGTIHGGLNGPLEYRIRAGGGDNAIASLWELGNKGSRPVADKTFRHPVFGHMNNWVNDQPKHPFLRPALARDRKAITKMMEEMWDRALTPWRLRPNQGLGAADVSNTVDTLAGVSSGL